MWEIDGEKIILDKDFFYKKYVFYFIKDICKGFIYEYLEKDFGLKISFVKKEIFVDELMDEDKCYLDLKDYEYIVVVRNYVYLEDVSFF